MATGLIYKSPVTYELAMVALYGRHYFSRYRAISELIPYGTSVLDVCCGPATLYLRYLRGKEVRYCGLDINDRFITRLLAAGGSGHVWDVSRDIELPTADYVIMQASLYHFLPDPSPVLDRMLRAAQDQVIIAEPIRNVMSSQSSVLGRLAKSVSDPGYGNHCHRFTETTLERCMEIYSGYICRSFLIKGGREKVYVLGTSQ